MADSGSSAGARKPRAREWHLYVLELEDAAGPGRLAGKPNLYVGQTQRTVLERLGTHLTDRIKGSRKVREYFRAIRFDLFDGMVTYASEADALAAETRLAERLRGRGYSVVNDTGKPFKPRSQT